MRGTRAGSSPTPTCCTAGSCPAHQKWSSTLRRVAYVVIDECHAYRGVFGSHVGHVLRRLRRICRRYGAEPVFVLASATVGGPGGGRAPAGRARRWPRSPTTGRPGPAATFALWEPPLTERTGEHGAPLRRVGRRRRRRAARRPGRAGRPDAGVRPVAAQRGVGRRPGPRGCCTTAGRATWCGGSTPTAAATCPRSGGSWSGRCPPGELLGRRDDQRPRARASTSPAWTRCVLAGYPGTLASLWQQAGRAGRAQRESLVVFVARDDPLDHYLAHHPRAVFGAADRGDGHRPDEPLRPRARSCAARPPSCRCAGGPRRRSAAAAAEAQLDGAGRRRTAAAAARRLVLGRPGRAPTCDIRGSGGEPVSIIEAGTGRLLGTVDGGAAHSPCTTGALYVHRGETFVVDEFDVEDACAVVHADEPGVDDGRPGHHRPRHRLDRPQPRGWARSPRTPAWST